jgi:hypothetical protein
LAHFQVLKAKPGLLNLQNIPDDSDDEEHFVDLEEEDVAEDDSSDEEKPRCYDAEPKHLVKSWSSTGGGSWVHRKNVTGKLSLVVENIYMVSPQKMSLYKSSKMAALVLAMKGREVHIVVVSAKDGHSNILVLMLG